MKKIFTLLLTIGLYALNGFTQNIEIKGSIVDKKTKKGIIYATLEIKTIKTGVYTDEEGRFSISIPPKNLNDIVEVSSLGYERKTFIAKDLSYSIKAIELKQEDIRLKEVVILPKKMKTVKLGTTEKVPWNYVMAIDFGRMVVTHINNKKNKKGYVRSVSCYIDSHGKSETPFRIRIYGVDKANNGPGMDLLKENVIVTSNKKDAWLTIDVSKYGIDFPEDGMFVGIEWINAGDQFYYPLPAIMLNGKPCDIKKCYGITIGMDYNKESHSWGKTSLGQGWSKYEDRTDGYINIRTKKIRNYNGCLNLMINADIDFLN